MDVITRFDPWGSKLCTCPEKYSFNPYTGCAHGCIYCYSTYIPRFYKVRRKRNLIGRVKRDLRKLPHNALISMSNSSDPYPSIERKLKDTRKCLSLFKHRELRLLVITKSDLVLQDLDYLEELRCAVTFTITSFEQRVYEKLEPDTPSPEHRLQALRRLVKAKIPVGVRLDPVFLGLTDEEIEKIIKRSAEGGAMHVVTSTFKPRADSWHRFKVVFPEHAKRLKHLYFSKGKRMGSAWYLPKELRKKLMIRVREACDRYGIKFATCREGFPELHTAESCDGSHLIPKKVKCE